MSEPLNQLLASGEPEPEMVNPLMDTNDDLRRYIKAFGAGLIDPAGLTGWAARGASHMAPGMLSPETAKGFQDTMQRARAGSYIASGAGSMLVPGLGFAGTVGRMTLPELARGAPLLAALGGQVGNLYESVRSGYYPENPPKSPMPGALEPLPGAPY